jgi:DNA repair protein RadC
MRLRDLSYEVFAIIYLDNRNRVIKYAELFRGTIDGATVHPREVVKEALANNAVAVILAHNHPSGVAEPSQADELTTQRLKESLAVVFWRTTKDVAAAEVLEIKLFYARCRTLLDVIVRRQTKEWCQERTRVQHLSY